MSEFVINTELFGRYARIPTGYSKAPHVYKVISAFESNSYCDTPIFARSEPTLHQGIVPVLNVVHCGIDESEVIRVALSDCQFLPEVRKMFDLITATPEALADAWLNDNNAYDFCQNKPECNELLENDREIDDSSCKKCLLAWLNKEAPK